MSLTTLSSAFDVKNAEDNASVITTADDTLTRRVIILSGVLSPLARRLPLSTAEEKKSTISKLASYSNSAPGFVVRNLKPGIAKY